MDSKAVATLDQIAQGGQVLVALAQGRLAEAKDALDHGDFDRALDRLNEAAAKIQPLAFAQNNIGRFNGSMVVRARDLQEGMVLMGMGEVKRVDFEVPDCGSPEHVAVAVDFESGAQQVWHADSELLLETGPR